MILRRTALVARLVLGCVFVYAAYTKLRQPWEIFALSIDSYGLLPAGAVVAAARALPWVELAIGLLLLSGFLLRYVSAAAALLLGTFFGVMLYEYGRGAGIDCGCFGVGEALSVRTLLRDGSLLALSIGIAVNSVVVGRRAA